MKGLAELIRLLCKYGDIEFEDNRIEREEWPELKLKTPFGQVPLYEESLAIARYIAKKVKLTGISDWEDLEIDAMVDTYTDFRLKCTQVAREEDETNKVVLMKTLKTGTIPYYLEKLTWVDIYAYIILDGLIAIIGTDVDGQYSNLCKLKENV